MSKMFLSYSDYLIVESISEDLLKYLTKGNLKDKLINSLKVFTKYRPLLLKSALTIMLSVSSVQEITTLAKQVLDNTESILVEETIKELTKDEQSEIDFLKHLAYKESSNDWTAVNRHNYIGKYQLGKIALLDIYDKLDLKYFNKLKGSKESKVEKLINEFSNISNSNLSEQDKKDKLNLIFSEKEQDQAVMILLEKNKHYLRNYKSYIGQTINGVKISWNGMLAAAHLRGAKAVKKYLDSNGKVNMKDAFNTSVADYLKEFSGY